MTDIVHLADAAHAVPELAAAFLVEWPSAGITREEVEVRFRECLRRDGLPLALVAREGGAVLGTVGLRWDSVDCRPAYGPWLAAFWVTPARRGQGIGSALARAAEHEARRLGFAELFTGTAGAASLFRRLGWAELERVLHRGEDLVILRRELG